MEISLSEQISAVTQARRDIERELRNGQLSGEDQNFLSAQSAALAATLETLRALRDLNAHAQVLQKIISRPNP